MNFPKQNIPEKKKDKDFHLKCINAIIYQYKNNTEYGTELKKDFENYLIVEGIFDHKKFEYITDMYGLTSPARLVNHPLILPKLDLLAGELVSQDLVFTINVTNKNAVRKKNEERMQVAAETLLRPIRQKVAQAIGMEIPDEDLGREVPKDIEEFQSMKFRVAIEEMADAGLKYIIQKWKLKNVFKRGFYDMSITSKSFYRTFIKNNDPCVERIDPRKIIYDKSTKAENIKNSKFAGHQDWYTIDEILDEYGTKLTVEDVNKMEDLQNVNSSEALRDYSISDGYYYDSDELGVKVLVVKAEWKSLKTVKYKVSENPYDVDNPFYKRVKDDYKPKKDEKIVERVVTEIRRATKIGHDILVDYGVKPNQVRHEENYSNATLSYHGVIKNNFSGVTVSVVDSLKNIQLLYNIVIYHIEAALARSGGKSVVYDVAQKPKGMPISDVMYHAKNSGLILINSAQEGIPAHFNQFQQVDFTLSQSVSQLINLKYTLEDTADKLTGISAARSGMQKSGDLVGVNERNVMQSSLITAPLFDLHYSIVSDVLQDLVDLMKIAWANEGRIANVIGDTGFTMIQIDKSIAAEELGIFVENSSKDSVRKQEMRGMMERLASTGNIDPLTMIKAINADNAAEIEAIMTAGIKTIQSQQMELEERKVAAQEQSNQIETAKIQIPLEVAKMQTEKDMKIAEMRYGLDKEKFDKQLDHDEFKEEQDRDSNLDEMALQNSMQNQQQVPNAVETK